MRNPMIAVGMPPAPSDLDDTLDPRSPGPVPDWSVVQTALDHSVDAKAGYDAMLLRCSDGFKPVVERFLDLHNRHADALGRILAEAGQVPGDGTMMSVVNRTVVAVRGAFGEIGPEAVDRIRDGERQVIEAFKAAIDHPLPDAVRGEISTMRKELDVALDEIAHLV